MITIPSILTPTIAHIDCDCFFVSVELIDKPHLKGKPVCVAGPTGNQGVVTCASYEARRSGIRAGTPTFKAKQICPEATFIKGNSNKYGKISFQLFDIINQFTPTIEHTSIDEGYANLANLDKVHRLSYHQLIQKIQTTIETKLKIPVSIGLAPTKTLAKIASKKNKPYGLLIVDHNNLTQVLQESQIKDVCGFGRRLQIHIQQQLHVDTLQEFIQLDPTLVKAKLGKNGLLVWYELQGLPLRKVQQTSKPPQSILRSAMFPNKTSDYNFIHNWLASRLEEAVKKLNRHQLNCRSFSIFLRKQHPNKVSTDIELTFPSADLKIIGTLVKKALPKIYNSSHQYRAAGVWLHKFSPQHNEQLNLFATNKKTTIAELLNQCDEQFGPNTVTTSSRLSFIG